MGFSANCSFANYMYNQVAKGNLNVSDFRLILLDYTTNNNDLGRKVWLVSKTGAYSVY